MLDLEGRSKVWLWCRFHCVCCRYRGCPDRSAQLKDFGELQMEWTEDDIATMHSCRSPDVKPLMSQELNCCSEVQSPVFRWKWILRIISKMKLPVQGCQTSNTVGPTCETLLSVSLYLNIRRPVSAAHISFSARWTNLSARLFGIKL